MRSEMTRRDFLGFAAAFAVAARQGIATPGQPASGSPESPGDMPTVKLGPLRISRLIIGGNPFSGNSHFSPELSKEMKEYYTPERIKAALKEASRFGVNAILARADANIMGVLREYWKEGGSIRIWFAQHAPEKPSVIENIDEAAEAGAKAVYIHGGVVDKMFAKGELEKIWPWLEHIKEKGLLAGMAAHRPEVHLAAHEMKLPVDFYCQCFYNLTIRGENYLPEDRDMAVQTVRQLRKPVIAYKIMAAGRNEPTEAFRYAFSHLRPGDAVCVGVFPKHRPREIEQDATLTREFGKPQPGEKPSGQRKRFVLLT